VEGDGARPILVRSGDGETVTDRAERTIRILGDRGEMVVSLFRYEAGEDGPEPHVHKQHTDAFYVLEGELEIALGPDVEPFAAGAGSLAAAPPNVVHTFRNASDRTALFLNIHAPSMRFGEMLRARRDGWNGDAEGFDQFEPPADGGRPLAEAVFRGPGEGETIGGEFGGVLAKADSSETDGSLSLAETLVGPETSPIVRDGGGAEAVYLLEGRLSLDLGGEEVTLRPGDFALLPPGRAHTFANRTGEPARLLSLVAPA
jgi:quercetin dioxygenase-like cupin family protein